MGAVSKDQIPDVANFMPEFWEIIKRFWIVEDTDEYWEEAIFACDQICKKYNNLFVRRMVLAYVDYLEEICKALPKTEGK